MNIYTNEHRFEVSIGIMAACAPALLPGYRWLVEKLRARRVPKGHEQLTDEVRLRPLGDCSTKSQTVVCSRNRLMRILSSNFELLSTNVCTNKSNPMGSMMSSRWILVFTKSCFYLARMTISPARRYSKNPMRS